MDSKGSGAMQATPPGVGVEPSKGAGGHALRKQRSNPSMLIAALVGVSFFSLAGLYLASVAPDLRISSPFSWVPPDGPYEAPPSPNKDTPALPPDALASIPLGYRLELMTPVPKADTELSRSFSRPIDQLCSHLAGLSLGTFTAMHNPIADGQWICTSDILSAVPSAPTASSSVFVWMRGTDRREVDLVRLKINLIDPPTSQTAKALALNVLREIHEQFGWGMPEALVSAINNVREANFVRYGVSYQLIRERSSPSRLNLIIRIIDRSGTLPIDEFVRTRTFSGPLAHLVATARLKPSMASSP